MTLTAYINYVRVQKSTELLKTNQISAVYFLCGFKNPQQYFLNFKKYYGCTPKEYLTRNGN
jgi:AraC-like DNA-binding protein